MKRKFYNDLQSTIGYTFHSQWCFAFSSPHSLQFIIPPHFLMQLLLHSVKEVSTAMVLASSDVGVETIAVLGFDTKELVHGLRQVLELHIAIIHASHDADAIYHFYKVNGIASPFYSRLPRMLIWIWHLLLELMRVNFPQLTVPA